ncbi:UNVERIFIED_CONTAM: hypothetical protein RMT77_011133 [Armadillidium vulgare]
MKTDTKIFFTGFSFCIQLLMTLGKECDEDFESMCKGKAGCYCEAAKVCILIPEDYTLTYNQADRACANVRASLFDYDQSVFETVKQCITDCGKTIGDDYVFCVQGVPRVFYCPCLHVEGSEKYFKLKEDCYEPQVKNITNLCFISC